MEVQSTVQGKYEMQLLDAKDQSVLQTWKFNNIITDGGMNLFGSTTGGESFAFDYFQVGEGSTPVSSSDTGLVSPIAGRINTSDTADVITSGSDVSGSFWQVAISRIFYEASGNGNITEIGAFSLASGGRLTSRALVRDDLGDPTTLTKTSANQLRIIYTFRMYVPTLDITGSLFMAGTTYDYVLRPQGIFTSYQWGYGPTLSGPTQNGGHIYEFVRGRWTTHTNGAIASPSGSLVSVSQSIALGGTVSACSSVNLQGYVDNTFYRDVEFVFNPSVANFGTTGVRALKLQPVMASNLNPIGGDSHYQMTFTPPIPKTNLNQLTLRFRFSWDRSKIYE